MIYIKRKNGRPESALHGAFRLATIVALAIPASCASIETCKDALQDARDVCKAELTADDARELDLIIQHESD